MPCSLRPSRRSRPSESSRFPLCVLSPFSALLSRSDFHPVIYTYSPRQKLTVPFSLNCGHTVRLQRLLLFISPSLSRLLLPAPPPPPSGDPAITTALPIAIRSAFSDLRFKPVFLRSEPFCFVPYTLFTFCFSDALRAILVKIRAYSVCCSRSAFTSTQKRPPRIYPDGLPRYSSDSVSSGSACTYLFRACAGSPLSIGLFGVSTTSVLSDN